jgi:uncharacterized protein YggE
MLELKMRPLQLLFAPLMAALLFAGAPARADDDAPKRKITIAATGEVEVVPDIARITSGVTTEAATAKAALARNSELMKKVVDGLKAAGVADKDIQTSSLRIEPRYTRPKEGEAAQIEGYRVTNEVQFVARDLDKLGDVLDQLVSLGANQTSGLSFEATAAETLRDEARKQAVANAKRRAELYATAAGVQLGEILSIDEGGAEPPHPVYMARAAKAAVPIERGSETLSAGVTIVWALK